MCGAVYHKREAAAYTRIAEELAIAPDSVLFLSDLTEELDAAAAAGMETTQLVRDDNVVTGSHRIAHNFHEVTID